MEKSLVDLIREIADKTLGPQALTVNISLDQKGNVRVSGRIQRYIPAEDAHSRVNELDPPVRAAF